MRLNLIVAMLMAVALVGCVSLPPEEVKAKDTIAPQVVAVPPPVVPAPVVIAQPAQTVLPAPPPPQVIIQTEPAKIPEEVTALMDFLNDWQRYNEMSVEELRRELASAASLFNKLKSDAHRLRYGIALSLTSNTFADDQRALSLLDPLLVRGSREPLKLIASLVAAHLQDRQKLLKDEQKKSENLQQKLDALRSIEQSLRNRR